MPRTAIFAKITSQPGKRDELVGALKPLLDAVESEDGTLSYALHTDNTADDVVWFYELYADDAALKAHMGSDAMKQVFGVLGGLVAGPAAISNVTPVGGKGLSLG